MFGQCTYTRTRMIPTYQAARTVATLLETHFAKHLTSTCQLKRLSLAPTPGSAIIETIIDTAFWASLRHEEGASPKISLAFLPASMADHPLLFAQRLPLTPTALNKLAPAVERPGIHLGVDTDEEGLYIWGTTQEIPGNCFVLEVIEPGLLVIKHRRLDGFGKFVNVAILQGDNIKIIDEYITDLPAYLSSLTSMVGFHLPSAGVNSMNVLVDLSISMRAHRRGGTLLVVPGGTKNWQESIIHPITYPIVPAFSQLSTLMKMEQSDPLWWQGNISQAVESLAGLTAVDGATIINDQYELLGFGAKIGRSDGNSRIEQVLLTEPLIDYSASIIHPTQTGGTRHLSAAQFVFDQRDSIALVASQDGRFTVFAWSDQEQMVRAHRIDALLL
ncbi:MAG: hypothetical protein QM669_09230 [Siphonobacter sp.]